MEDREAAARAIAEAAKRTRRPLPRGLWIASLVVSAVCVIAFAVVFLFSDSDPRPEARGPRSAVPASNGFSIGLVIGLGSGIAIGSVMALRTRKRD